MTAPSIQEEPPPPTATTTSSGAGGDTAESPPPPAPPPPPTQPALSSASLRLTRGAIPSAWTKPAEVVTTLPEPAKRPLATGIVVAVGVVACAGLAVVFLPTTTTSRITPPAAVVAPPTTTTTAAIVAPPSAAPPPSTTTATTAPPASAAPASAAAAPMPVEAIPLPPKTSSSDPSEVAPEDQGGDDASRPLVTELPVRKKARGLTSRAIALLRDGDSAGAEPLLKRAVIIDPSHADAWRHLGIARAQLGDREGARRAYRKYLALAPNAPDAAQVRQILGK